MQLRPRPFRRLQRLVFLAGAALLAFSGAARAQSAIMYGSLGNFDILNETGQVCHGFQIDLAGVPETDIAGLTYFTANRYGTPTATATALGVTVRWEAPYDSVSGTWATRTLNHTVPWFQGQCYQWVTATYQDGGCEHYGVRSASPAVNTAATSMRWLCEDPNTPGALVPIDPPSAVAAPTYFIAPPAVVAAPPALVIEVPAPEPAEAPQLYGDAQWIRFYKQDMPRFVELGELLADNPAVVPGDPAQLEADYAIIQTEPAAGGNGNRRRKRHQSDIAPATRAVVRRIELYHFTGRYDPVTHQAICADGTCTIPSAGELGDLISVQMSAANVIPDAVLVAKSGTGGGSVLSGDKLINCGNACAASYTAGDVVTLSAKANSNADFAGWGGACSGLGTCTVTVAGAVNVTAAFNLRPVFFTVSVGRSNPGTVIATPTGADRALNCGSACSAKFAGGTAVSLTATPPLGKSFVNWGGACTAAGTSPTCNVTVNSDLSVQANFSK